MKLVEEERLGVSRDQEEPSHLILNKTKEQNRYGSPQVELITVEVVRTVKHFLKTTRAKKLITRQLRSVFRL